MYPNNTQLITMMALSATLFACEPEDSAGPDILDVSDLDTSDDNDDGPDSDDGQAVDTSEDDAVDDGNDADDDDDGGKRHEDQGQQPPGPDAVQYLVSHARDQFTQTFTIDAQAYNVLEGDQGTDLYISPNTFINDTGHSVDGEIEIELIEVFDKGAMLVTDVPTNGRLPTGELAQLISGGEFYINATQNGQDLYAENNLMVVAPGDNTGGADSEMTLFELTDVAMDRRGTADLDEGDVDLERPAWEEVKRTGDEGAIWVEGDGDGGGGADGGTAGYGSQYVFLTQTMGWTNIDRWYSDPRPKTTIHVGVPQGWDSDNCVVYLSYDGENGLARFDTYNDMTGMFSEHYGLIPIGLEVHVIFVTESEGEWSYAVKGATVQDNHVTYFDDPAEFIETDVEGLMAAINALP